LFGRLQNQEEEDATSTDDVYVSVEHKLSVLYDAFMEVCFRFHVNGKEMLK